MANCAAIGFFVRILIWFCELNENQANIAFIHVKLKLMKTCFSSGVCLSFFLATQPLRSFIIKKRNNFVQLSSHHFWIGGRGRCQTHTHTHACHTVDSFYISLSLWCFRFQSQTVKLRDFACVQSWCDCNYLFIYIYICYWFGCARERKKVCYGSKPHN